MVFGDVESAMLQIVNIRCLVSKGEQWYNPIGKGELGGNAGGRMEALVAY